MKKALLITLGIILGWSLTLSAVVSELSVPSRYIFKNGFLVRQQSIQAIVNGDTINADSCGGVKNILSSGAVTTNATNPITAPTIKLTGCAMSICNVGVNDISIAHSATVKTATATDLVVPLLSCVNYTVIYSFVTNSYLWVQISPIVSNG